MMEKAMVEIARPTAPGVHIVRLKEGERMVSHEHNDPFRTHYYEGPARVKFTIGKDGGATTVYGWAND